MISKTLIMNNSRRLRMLRRMAGAVVVAALACPAAGVARAESSAPSEAKPFTQAIPSSDVTFEMLPIPGGKFKMGSPEAEEDRGNDEGPQFDVQIDPFYMGKHEVTWAEYKLFLNNYARLAGVDTPRPVIPPDQQADAVTYPTPLYELEAGPILERMGRTDKHPAVIMSQYGAKQYTKWLSKKTGRFYRLPTEAEWEYACRAGTDTPYSFGDDPEKLTDYGWYFDNSQLDDGDGAYRPVGLKKPNPWGLYDMHGNVAEIVVDTYDENQYKKFAGTTVKWHDAVAWPTEQYPRLARGGGWSSDPEACRSASRVKITANDNKQDPQLPRSPYWLTEGFWIGFRVVSPVSEPSEAEKLKYWNADDENTKRNSNRDRDIHELLPPALSQTSQAK